MTERERDERDLMILRCWSEGLAPSAIAARLGVPWAVVVEVISADAAAYPDQPLRPDEGAA